MKLAVGLARRTNLAARKEFMMAIGSTGAVVNVSGLLACGSDDGLYVVSLQIPKVDPRQDRLPERKSGYL